MSRLRKRLTRLACLLFAGLLMIVMLRWFEHSQVYHPDRQMIATGSELGRPVEQASFGADDGVRLHGWFFPASTNSPRSHWVVLVCHGNAGNISHRLDMCQAILETGVGVFLFDYRGYGLSQGRPSEDGTYRDAIAAYDWLERRGVAGTSIIAMGESLGGGIASELAIRKPLAGLILQSTFTSVPDIGKELFPWLPVRTFGTIKYDTRSKLPRIKVPVLVMHSPQDDLIPLHHGRNNFAAANEPKQFWELKGGHNEAVTDRANFTGGVEKFLRLLETNNAPATPLPASGLQAR